MKKILLLTDFSEASRKAIHYAQALFSDVAAEFQLLHTYIVDTADAYGAVLYIEEIEKQVTQQLKTLLAEITTQPVPDHHQYTTRSYPSTPIGTVEWLLSKEHFDYIVLGASGTGNNPLFGSVATGLIRRAGANILIVPDNAPIRPLRQVVLATDYRSINHLHSLRPLKDMLTLKGANLTFLTIRGRGNQGQALAEKSLALTNYFDTVGTETYFVRNDEVEKGIDEYLATHPVDLLVTVPHHRSLLDILMGRSTTRKLAYHPQVPLLCLYDPEGLPVEIDEKDIDLAVR